MSLKKDDIDLPQQILDELGEMPTITMEEAERIKPETIRQYERKMAENKAVSIYDTDYDYTEYESEERKRNKNISTHLPPALSDEGVIYVSMGRGKKMFNYSKPGTKIDEITYEIRKVCPLGYSDEFIVQTVKQNQMEERMKREAKLAISPSNNQSEQSVSTISESDLIVAKCPDENGLKPIKINVGLSESPIAHDTIPKKAPPLSEILKQGRISRDSSKTKTSKPLNDADEASKRKIEDISKNDNDEQKTLIQRETRRVSRQKINENFECDSKEKCSEEIKKSLLNKFVSPIEIVRSDIPSWRQRNKSPPKFPWGHNGVSSKQIDFRSKKEFPNLGELKK